MLPRPIPLLQPLEIRDRIVEGRDRNYLDIVRHRLRRDRIGLGGKEYLGSSVLGPRYLLLDPSDRTHASITLDRPGACDLPACGQVVGREAVVEGEREHQSRGRARDLAGLEL